MVEADAIQILLAGRAGVYRIFQNIFGNEPSAETLEQLSDESTHQVFRLFSEGQTEYGQVLDVLMAKAEECRAGGEKVITKLENSFTRLFVGPNPPEANPWESFYLGGESSLFQQMTLEIRNVYRTQGLLPAAYPHVADDHVAIELDFLARLAERAETSWAVGDKTVALNSLVASEEFLRGHLTKWVSQFAISVSASRYADFYQETAAVLVAYLPIDLDALSELQVALGTSVT